MTPEEVSRQLHGVQEQHKDDRLYTGQIIISDMAKDAADAIDELIEMNDQLSAALKEANKELHTDSIGNSVIQGLKGGIK